MADEDLLSPEEVNALMQAVSDGDVGDLHSAHSNAALDAQEYDFTAPGRIISSIVPTLEMINDRFAHAMGRTLLGMTQQFADVTALNVQMVTMADYLRTLPVPCSVNMVRVTPLRGTALVVFEPHLVTCTVDAFFGGGRRTMGGIDRTSFSAVEKRVIRKLLDAVFADLAQAWHTVMELHFDYVGSESNPAYVNVAGISETETMVVTVLNVGLEGGTGAVHVLMPYAMLEPLRSRLTATIQSGDDDESETFHDGLMGGLAQVGVKVASTLVRAEITLDQLMRLQVGDVIPVQMPPGVTLDVDGVPVYQGLYGTVGETHAVQITGPAIRS